MMRDRLLRYDFCRSQLRPCETRTDVEASSSSTSDEEDEDNKEKKKADEQEQKWVRKIIALAKQEDKSSLSAKAKMLFRMMKADLCNSASSSEEEEDSDNNSSESEDSYTCTGCGHEFSSLASLGQHRRYW